MVTIKGGVTAPQGFKASGTAAGLKKNGDLDLALVYSEDTCVTLGVYTTNVVKGHSLQVTAENLKKGYANAVLINSGGANACVGRQGYLDAKEITEYCAEKLNIAPEHMLIGSTGVIGYPLKKDLINAGIDKLTGDFSNQENENGGNLAAKAIMTTDTFPKEIAVDLVLDGKHVKIGAMAKGSGMIHPNMATMISIITTDANISRKTLEPMFRKIVGKTYNRVSIDGDTSVCDMTLIFANGLSNDTVIEEGSESYEKYSEALEYVCTELARMLAKDGEGATKLLEIQVKNAITAEDAYKIVVSVAKSPLVKTAVFGEDANWGRIITAAGYSGAKFNPETVDIFIGGVKMCENGKALPFDEEKAKEALHKDEILVTIDLKAGEFFDRMWTCDFSYDYVKINGSYRS